jgi:hypothetical protein
MIILKISLGIFYLRIVVARWQQVTIYVTVGIAAIYGSYYFFAILFSCGLPANFLLNAIRHECHGTVQSRYAVNMTAGIVNAASDFVLAILPIALIRKACIPLPAKISASLVLLLGCIGSAISVVRLVYIHGLSYNINYFSVGVNITLWSVIEAGLCITAASLATLRPLGRCCVERTRSAITPGHSTCDTSKSRHHRHSSVLSFADCGSSTQGNEEWPLRKPEAALPNMREMDNMRTPSPGFSDAGITRKASLINGKMQWLESHDSPPSQPRRSEWLSSEDHPAYRHKPVLSGPKFTFGPAKLLRTASKSSLRGGPRHARTTSTGGGDLSPDSPRLEEVGVGAWRVRDEKGDRRR